MTVVQAAVGASIVLVVLLDVAWTTIAAGSAAGPLTGRLAAGLWRLSLRWHRRHPSHTFLSITGVVIVFAVLAVWIALTLVGWALFFTAATGAVREADTTAPADFVERLYFTGYTVFTLGNGDLVPGEGVWQLGTVAATASGLVLITLGITYLVPVASAVSERRQLASYINSLGATGQEIVTNCWDGVGFGALPQHLVSLAPLVHGARQRHLTYPVLHYFHSKERESALAPSIVALGDALELLRFGVASEARLSPGAVEVLDHAVTAFLGSVGDAYLPRSRDPLPIPSLDALRAAGIPTVDDSTHESAVVGEGRARTDLRALLHDDGWDAEDDDGDRPP